MRALKILLKIAGAILVAFSLVPLGMSFILFWLDLHFVKSSSRAQAIVMRVVEKTNEDGLKVYYPVFQYRDAQGKEHEARGNGWSDTKHEVTTKLTTTESKADGWIGTRGTTSYEVSSNYVWSPPEQKVGARVTVLYNRNDPGDARADTFDDIWGDAVSFGRFGGLPFVLGLGLFFVARRIGRTERRSVAAKGVLNTIVSPPMPPPLPTPAFNSMAPSPLYPNTITYQIPRGALIRLGYVLLFRRFRVIRGIFGFLALAAVFYLLGLRSGAFASLLFAASLPLVCLWTVIRAVGSPDVSGPRTMAFGPSGTVTGYGHHRGKSAWSRFKSFREDATYFYLYDSESSRNPVAFIPRAVLAADQTEQFRRYVSVLNVRSSALEKRPLPPPDLADPTEAALYTHTVSYQIPRDVLIRLKFSLGFGLSRAFRWALAILAAATLFYFGGGKTAAFACILLGISLPLLWYWIAIRTVDDGNLSLPTTLSFGPAGIVLIGSNYRIESAWTRYKAFSEDADYLYLHMTKRSQSAEVVVPKAALSPQQQEEFRGYGSPLNGASASARS